MSDRVMITGAGGALGSALAERLHGRGFELVLVSRKPGPVSSLARRLNAKALPWDITRDPALMLDIAGPCQHLICCAGLRLPPEQARTLEGAQQLMAVNCFGALALVRAFAAQSSGGVALLFGSSQRQGALAASHAALAALVPELAEQLSPGLRVKLLLRDGPDEPQIAQALESL